MRSLLYRTMMLIAVALAGLLVVCTRIRRPRLLGLKLASGLPPLWSRFRRAAEMHFRRLAARKRAVACHTGGGYRCCSNRGSPDLSELLHRHHASPDGRRVEEADQGRQAG